jgi:hypothetical protein
MTPAINNGGHSAKVKIQLMIDGSSIPVAQLGRDFLILNKPFNHPPSDAGLILQVDQNERRWNICLPNGISAMENRVAIQAVE